MAVEKAAIYYQENEIDKDFSGKIDIMFNPEKYKIIRNVNYNKDNMNYGGGLKDYPFVNFTGGSLDKLNLELIINRYNFVHYSNAIKYKSRDIDITGDVRKIKALTLIKPNLHQPPMCKFSWSSFKFVGYVTSVSVEYTMFLDDGTPVRAKIALEILGFEEGIDSKVPYESPDRTKVKILKENQQLWQIAAEEYNDASKWREIAAANNIDNPLYIKSGTELIVPALKK